MYKRNCKNIFTLAQVLLEKKIRSSPMKTINYWKIVIHNLYDLLLGNADQTLMSDGEFAEEDLLENGTQVPSPTSENFSDPDNTQYEHEESIHDNYIDPAGEHVEEQLDNRSNTIASALATNQEIEPQANNDILHNEELVHNQHNCCGTYIFCQMILSLFINVK